MPGRPYHAHETHIFSFDLGLVFKEPSQYTLYMLDVCIFVRGVYQDISGVSVDALSQHIL